MKFRLIQNLLWWLRNLQPEFDWKLLVVLTTIGALMGYVVGPHAPVASAAIGAVIGAAFYQLFDNDPRDD